ncbi:hypothetical protein JB92DRAFT_2762480 [Gautieria morchelliformis]|nr:hypothetical protein JB92DRAFT_2762480 [Gautieria morchelliformis]
MYTVAVAHYGHPSFKVKHWVIIVLFNAEQGFTYQITGSSMTYELKPITSITVLESNNYLGKVTVGTVHKDRLVEFGQIIAAGRIVHGNSDWNCQNWVMERLDDLRLADYAIRDIDHAGLLDELATTSREG